jgi:hypothetical protein
MTIDTALLDVVGYDRDAGHMLTLLADLYGQALQGKADGKYLNLRLYVRIPWDDMWKLGRFKERSGRRVLKKLTRMGYIRTASLKRSGDTSWEGRAALHVTLIEAALLKAWNAVSAGEAPPDFSDENP